MSESHRLRSNAIFITFSGNCRKALTFYQQCFGGKLQFETFEKNIEDYHELPVVSGWLVADQLTIYGSDLVHSEGRKVGNHLAIFVHCNDTVDRKKLIEKLATDQNKFNNEQKLIEIVDAFDVRWILGV